MLTPGDAANIGGRPITGVAGPSGCVRSTMRSRPVFRSATSRISVSELIIPSSTFLGKVALKLEAILEEAKAGDERRRSDGVHLRDDRGQLAAGDRVVDAGDERLDGRDHR